MKNGIFIIITILFFSNPAMAEIRKTLVNRPWIFFDLGDTVIDTKNKKW